MHCSSIFVALIIAQTALAAAIWLAFGWAADTLIWLERERYRSEWQRDGRPYSLVMWMPGEDWTFRSWCKGFWCAGRWLVWAPSWAVGDNHARTRLIWMRASVAVAVIILLPSFVATVTLIAPPLCTR